MVAKKAAPSAPKRAPKRAARTTAKPAAARMIVARTVMEEADRAGLLNGETEHVSFRAPKALVEAAMRETGATTRTELGMLALAMLARPDPVAEFMKKNYGKLGADHTLDY